MELNKKFDEFYEHVKNQIDNNQTITYIEKYGNLLSELFESLKEDIDKLKLNDVIEKYTNYFEDEDQKIKFVKEVFLKIHASQLKEKDKTYYQNIFEIYKKTKNFAEFKKIKQYNVLYNCFYILSLAFELNLNEVNDPNFYEFYIKGKLESKGGVQDFITILEKFSSLDNLNDFINSALNDSNYPKNLLEKEPSKILKLNQNFKSALKEFTKNILDDFSKYENEQNNHYLIRNLYFNSKLGATSEEQIHNFLILIYYYFRQDLTFNIKTEENLFQNQIFKNKQNQKLEEKKEKKEKYESIKKEQKEKQSKKIKEKKEKKEIKETFKKTIEGNLETSYKKALEESIESSHFKNAFQFYDKNALDVLNSNTHLLLKEDPNFFKLTIRSFLQYKKSNLLIIYKRNLCEQNTLHDIGFGILSVYQKKHRFWFSPLNPNHNGLLNVPVGGGKTGSLKANFRKLLYS